MKRRDKHVIKVSGKYEVVEIEIFDEKTEQVVDVCFEVRSGYKFLTEFDNEHEALQQLEFFITLEE